MSDKKDTPKLDFITPKAPAIYPKLNEPDTKFVAEGVYETKLRIDPSAEDGVIGKNPASWAEIVEKLEELRDNMLAEKKAELAASKDPKAKARAKTISAADIGTADLDDDGNENGLLVIKAKAKASGGGGDTGKKAWKRKITIFDAKGKKIENPPLIYGGSQLKVAVRAVPYYSPKDNIVGVTLYLEAVQVIELVSSGGGKSADSFGFGSEDGYDDTSDGSDGNF
jgi:hypothetical protein